MEPRPEPAPAGQEAGTGYFVEPEGGRGPGLLLLHSWWGLTPFFRGLAHSWADQGFSVLVPNLSAGALPETSAEAEVVLADADPNVTAALVLSSAHALRTYSVDSRRPIAVVGYSMGASWALWLSARLPESVSHVVSYYGAQNIDFSSSQATYLGHWAEHDVFVSDDEVVELHALLRLHGREVDFHRYPGTSHWFVEDDDRTAAYDPEAAELARVRTAEFLASLLTDP